MENINLAYLLILVALLQYLWFTARVGLKRDTHGVSAPSTTGNNEWDRLYRVQQNTMEQLIIFIPAMLAFAYYSGYWALIPGALFIIGRQVYSMTYIKDPKTRTVGMTMTLLANVILLLGALYGVLKAFL